MQGDDATSTSLSTYLSADAVRNRSIGVFAHQDLKEGSRGYVTERHRCRDGLKRNQEAVKTLIIASLEDHDAEGHALSAAANSEEDRLIEKENQEELAAINENGPEGRTVADA